MDPSRSNSKRIRLSPLEPVQRKVAPPSPSPSNSDNVVSSSSDSESSLDSGSSDESSEDGSLEHHPQDFDPAHDTGSDSSSFSGDSKGESPPAWLLRPTTSMQVDDMTPSDSDESASSEENDAEVSFSKDDDEGEEEETRATSGAEASRERTRILEDLRVRNKSLLDMDLLAKLKASNAQLEGLKQQGRLGEVAIDAVDDNEPYIEMNLGLGVLEEQKDEESSWDSEVEEQEQGAASDLEGPKETHFLQNLMDVARTKRKALVQEVEDAG
ncbi:Hypothetical protein D9617_14g077350 [Elsinoe fawcettii]|nr:Hypothetical protein D9617_14g077350 [Elsinoe fawcettii]